MNLQSIVISQYLASLEMLKETVTRCPEALWDDPVDQAPTWRLAYHALFYIHLYLQPDGKDFKAWGKHREDAQRIDPKAKACQTYTREEVLEYLSFCQQQVQEIVPQLDLESDQSGFGWLDDGQAGAADLQHPPHAAAHGGADGAARGEGGDRIALGRDMMKD